MAACRAHRIEALVMAASAPLSSEEARHLSWYLADERILLVLDTGLTEIAGAGAALVALSPVMLVLAMIAKTHDGRPVLFAQERTGLDGSMFKMLKFRSMYTDAEQRKAELMAANDAKVRSDPGRMSRPGTASAPSGEPHADTACALRWVRRHPAPWSHSCGR